jgi:putative transposase
MDPRKVLAAIVYVLRAGRLWKALPKEEFGSASSVHNYFLEWKRKGVFMTAAADAQETRTPEQ